MTIVSYRQAGIANKADNPVAYFTVDSDWDEVEVTLDHCPVGKVSTPFPCADVRQRFLPSRFVMCSFDFQYLLVKFLEARQPSAERLGVVGIKFYGLHRKSSSLRDHDTVRTAPVMCHVCVAAVRHRLHKPCRSFYICLCRKSLLHSPRMALPSAVM